MKWKCLDVEFSLGRWLLLTDGDFDFNVVIRSVLYQEKERYLSFTSGGAITYDSDPEAEFEETLLKGARIGELLFSIDNHRK